MAAKSTKKEAKSEAVSTVEAPKVPRLQEKYAKEVLAIRTKAQSTPVEQRLYFAD